MSEKLHWYDDRVRIEPCAPSAKAPDRDEVYKYYEKQYSENEKEITHDTPLAIYRYLDKHVWKQEEAKKAAAMLAYKCFYRDMKENLFFVGPSGCGKTYIWQCLKQIFPDRIEIVDGSNITQDGWKGSKKWASLLASPVFRKGKRTILVIDEADKMLAPKFASGGENVSHSIASEGLKFLEGTVVESGDCKIKTEKISIVLCGAFSDKACDIAEHDRGSSIGFGADPAKTKAYDRPLGTEDLLEFGVMPEFLGRIQSIVNLEPMGVDDYFRMLASSNGPLQRIGSQYQIDIKLSEAKCRELAQRAYQTGLGVRGMENQIRQMVDRELFEDWEKHELYF